MRMSKAGIAAAILTGLVLPIPAYAQSTPGAAGSEPAKAAASPAPAKSTEPAKATAPKAVTSSGPKSIVGEVVDPACWVINGAKGEAHKECTIACAKAGQTLAILERKTNKIYILASARPGEDPNKGVVDYAGQAVLVKGKVFTRGGLTAIRIASIEPYTSAKK
jgi:hypothetical protein